MSVNVCPDVIFWIAEPFTTKPDMVMHHHEPDCLPNRLFCCQQNQGHREGSYNEKLTFWYIFWTADHFATKLDFMAHHHKMDCLVKRFDCCVVVKVKVAGKVKNSSDCSSGWYSSTVEPAVTKLGMVMHHHGPECYARRLVGCLQVKVTLRAHIIQYDCFYDIYWTADLLATKFNWLVHRHKLRHFV